MLLRNLILITKANMRVLLQKLQFSEEEMHQIMDSKLETVEEAKIINLERKLVLRSRHFHF